MHISELADHHVDKAEDEVGVHDRVPVKIIDIDLDRRRISLSRKQAMQEQVAPAETTTAAEMELEPEAGAQATPDAEMELEPADIEIETRAASEDIGVATEDTIQRPQSDADLIAAIEGAPEMADEPSAPETATSAEAAGQAAPPEEREDAEAISMMSPDSPPEGHEGFTAAESDNPNMEVRIGQEEREPGATPGLATEEVIAAEEEDSAPVAEGFESARTEALDPADATGDESIEDIVEDIKRRGQS